MSKFTDEIAAITAALKSMNEPVQETPETKEDNQDLSEASESGDVIGFQKAISSKLTEMGFPIAPRKVPASTKGDYNSILKVDLLKQNPTLKALFTEFRIEIKTVIDVEYNAAGFLVRGDWTNHGGGSNGTNAVFTYENGKWKAARG